MEIALAKCEVTVSSPASLEGLWDSKRLDQIVDVLLANAIKYGAGKPVEIALSEKPAAAVLAVRDHGIGIAPDAQARIFERFERAVSSRHYGGLGLGLWFCREIVSAMGGRLAVQSAEGQGATFVVQLPRMAAAAPASSASA